MIDQAAPPPRRFPIAPIIIFPLVGPIAIVALMAVPLAIIGLFSLGPGGLFYYLLLASWWLPVLYALLGPPYFLTGLVFSLLAFLFGTRSLAVAITAAMLAFAAYFGAWLALPEDFARLVLVYDYANIRSGLFQPQSVFGIMLGTFGAWLVQRAVMRRVAFGVPDYSPTRPSARFTEAIFLVVALVAALGFAGVLYMIPRNPEQAWKECTDRNSAWDERIRGCSVIARRTEEPADRRATAYYRRGNAYDSGYRRYADAVADYTEAIRHNPQLAEAYLNRGLAYAQLHQYDKVVPDLDAGLRLISDKNQEWLYHVYRERGLARARAGDLDGAIADHSDEIRLTPRFADGRLHRAAAYSAKGDTAKALADLTDAIRIEPYRSPLYVARGDIHMKLGDDEKALADFDEAIRRQANVGWTAPAYRKRGEIMEKRGDLAAALAAYEKAVQLNAADGEAVAGRDRLRAK